MWINEKGFANGRGILDKSYQRNFSFLCFFPEEWWPSSLVVSLTSFAISLCFMLSSQRVLLEVIVTFLLFYFHVVLYWACIKVSYFIWEEGYRGGLIVNQRRWEGGLPSSGGLKLKSVYKVFMIIKNTSLEIILRSKAPSQATFFLTSFYFFLLVCWLRQ